jgi:hypothetical protein
MCTNSLVPLTIRGSSLPARKAKCREFEAPKYGGDGEREAGVIKKAIVIVTVPG